MDYSFHNLKSLILSYKNDNKNSKYIPYKCVILTRTSDKYNLKSVYHYWR